MTSEICALNFAFYLTACQTFKIIDWQLIYEKMKTCFRNKKSKCGPSYLLRQLLVNSEDKTNKKIKIEKKILISNICLESQVHACPVNAISSSLWSFKL